MFIGHEILEHTCKNAIETILLCLEHAVKGTIYRIGPLPHLQAERITSGIRENDNGGIRWGLPEVSDYNPPGKIWDQYRDRPGHLLEAMGWCVEKQKSWTADNPHEDARSVRRQLFGEAEDYYHLEPVLVRQVDVYGDALPMQTYPRDWQGTPIWKDTEWAVVAVIKIHFRPLTIQRGDRSTKIIKKLSRTLGTELLSLHLRETYVDAREKLAQERLESCNLLSHELRNTLTKLAFVFSAVNTVMSFLREQWEMEWEASYPHMENKSAVIAQLNEHLLAGQSRMQEFDGMRRLTEELLEEQDKLGKLFLLPQQGENWLEHRIRPKWQLLLTSSRAWDGYEEEILHLIERLKWTLWVVTDPQLAQRMDHLPEDVRTRWPELVYTHYSAGNFALLEEIFWLLDHPTVAIRHKQQIKKALSALKVLIDIISRVEESANRVVLSLRSMGTHQAA